MSMNSARGYSLVSSPYIGIRTCTQGLAKMPSYPIPTRRFEEIACVTHQYSLVAHAFSHTCMGHTLVCLCLLKLVLHIRAALDKHQLPTEGRMCCTICPDGFDRDANVKDGSPAWLIAPAVPDAGFARMQLYHVGTSWQSSAPRLARPWPRNVVNISCTCSNIPSLGVNFTESCRSHNGRLKSL